MKQKPYTVLFEHEFAGLAEHLTPIAEAWIQRGHRAVIAGPAREMDGLRAAHAGLPASAPLSFQSLEQTNRFDWPRLDALINAQPGNPGPAFRHPDSPWHIPRITINHGLTDKQTTFPADILGNTVGLNNILFACGEAMFKGSWEGYVKKWPEILHALKIIFIGSPKTDALFNGIHQRDAVLQSLNLPTNRPTILYAPTYQKEASLEQHGEAIVRALAALPVNLLVRLHHFSLNTESATARTRGNRGRNWNAVMHALETEYPNLRHVTGNSNPFFVAADLLVSDVSGASFEYILQDKPVIFYDVPEFFAAHGRDGVGCWGRDAGTIVQDSDELVHAVQQELAAPNQKALQRQTLIHQLVSQRGDSAEHAAETIEALIEGRIEYPTWGTRQILRQEQMMQACLRERLARCALEAPRLALFGAGAHTHRLLDLIASLSKDALPTPNITRILDDAAPPDAQLRGIPVVPPQTITRDSFDAIILSTDYHQAAMAQRCVTLFGADCPVINLYEAFPWHRPGIKANDEITAGS